MDNDLQIDLFDPKFFPIPPGMVDALAAGLEEPDEIAIIVGKQGINEGEGYLEIITIYEVGQPCKFRRTNRVPYVWDHFTEETPIIIK